MKQVFIVILLSAIITAFVYAQDEYSIAELSGEEYNELADSVFYFCGERSPDDSRWVLFPDFEEEAGQFPLIRTEQDGTPIYELCVFAEAEDIAWSPESDWFAFIDYDLLYNGGDQCIFCVNMFTEDYIRMGLHEIVESQDIGKRRELLVMDLGWLPSNDGIVFSVIADYLGTSGDDMIDQHRIEDLGDLFGKDDPVHVGYYVVYLTNK